MWYAVLVDDVTVGTVELPQRQLSAGRLAPGAAYGRIAPTVRAASRVLFAHGVYGPPLSARRDVERRRARVALAAAASLRVELTIPGDDERAPTVFVNLIESPADGGVVVIALFDDAVAAIGAMVGAELLNDAARARPSRVVRRRAGGDRSSDE